MMTSQRGTVAAQLRPWIVITVLALEVLIPVTCPAQRGASISGILTLERFDTMGRLIPTRTSTNEFRVVLNAAGQYLIRVVPGGRKGITYLAYDGSDTYYAYYPITNQPNNGNDPNKEILPPGAVLGGYVSAGNYPYVPWEEEKLAHILWVIVGAGGWLHTSKTNTVPLPWIPARWSLASYGFGIESELMNEPPYFPKTLTFLRDSRLDLHDFDAEVEREELDAPTEDKKVASLKDDLQERRRDWKDGAIAGKATVVTVTNYNGLALPMTFTMKTFYPFLGRIARSYSGVVTNVSTATPSESILPPILSPLMVIDTRMRYRDRKRSLDSIVYRVDTTQPWKSRHDPQLAAQFRAGLNSDGVARRLIPANVRRKREVIIGLIMLTALGWPLYLYRRAKRSERNT